MSETDLETCRIVKRLFDEERNRSGLTQLMLSKMIGKSPQTVSAILNKKMPVTLKVAQSLSKVFDVPVTEILPSLAGIVDDPENFDIIADAQNLTAENRAVLRRMIRNLLDSQEET